MARETWKMKDLKSRLIDKHERYEQMLQAIEAQIEDFEKIYRQLKLKVLPTKLKALKNQLETGSKQFQLLQDVIQRIYKC